MKRKLAVGILVFMMLFVIVGCGEETTPEVVSVTMQKEE